MQEYNFVDVQLSYHEYLKCILSALIFKWVSTFTFHMLYHVILMLTIRVNADGLMGPS